MKGKKMYDDVMCVEAKQRKECDAVLHPFLEWDDEDINESE